MKKVTLSVCLLFLFSGLSVAQEEVPEEIKRPEPPSITVYKDAIKYHSDWSDSLDDENFYNTLSFEIPKENSKKPEVIPFKKLPDIQKDVFYLKQAEDCSNRLLHLEKAWHQVVDAMGRFTDEQKKEWEEKYKDTKAEDKPPTKEEVEELIKEISKIRKSHAIKYEELLVKIFKKHKDVIPAIDRINYTRKIRAWNDKHKLIERNK
ncbi:MAG: hypothetical protein ACW99G_01240 [Candidatus Thorarchaeota archaeon]|jgi:hypothetical protein